MTRTRPTKGQFAIVLCLWLGLGLPARAGDNALPDYRTAAGLCAAEVETCLGIHLHVAVGEAGPVVDAGWMSAQVANANRLFAPLGVAFEVAVADALPAAFVRVADKAARDRLGHDRWKAGEIHVFVTGRLDNVDEPGEIYGVHWRDRSTTSHRWIILSAIAWSHTLVHELGHYFGLKHSKEPSSIMTKGARPSVPAAERVFLESQRKTMARRLKRFLRTGVLRARQRP